MSESENKELPDLAPLSERIFDLDSKDESYVIEKIDGVLPDYIAGNYYLNGPARFVVGGLRYRNWLDGDGMVSALRFEAGQVHFTNRFVRSVKYLAEAEADSPLFRMFGTAFEGDRLRRGVGTESPVNVSVYPYAGTLLAFGEQSYPFELDPVTLETRGPYTFQGRLNDISPFSAHPKFAPDTGDLYNFGISFAGVQPSLTLYRFDRSGNMIYRKRTPVDYPCTTHDFGLSPRFAVFYLCPYILDMQQLLQGHTATIDALKWEPERGSQLRLFLRESGDEKVVISFGNRYCLHLANCFESDNLLTVDVIEHDGTLYDQYMPIPDLFRTATRGGPVRYVVDTDRGEVVTRHEIAYYHSPDFPALDPRFFTQSYGHAWMLGISQTGKEGRKFFDELAHVRWEEDAVTDVYRTPPFHYLGGEPVFIGDPGDPKTGTILCQLFDAEHRRSAFVLFDAFDVAAGPIATLHLDNPIRLGFHSCFQSEV
ncbi:MAG: carotenoid oxygenase family protein [candidate division Zixibacteria bacterium]|nr:carotenoid oxygenase family protein [candidate division Zixibacteria bacterium]